MTKADRILNRVYQQLSIVNLTEKQKYNRINDIVTELQTINTQSRIGVKTTGTISERLCELALKSAVRDIYDSLSKNWKWVGDFSILGNPFNLIISVKSFKAKERLMASGSGNILSPTIGWGLFDDASEWSLARIKSYLFRAFIAIYMPNALLSQLPQTVKDIKNLNSNPFLRSINTFESDLASALIGSKIDITKV